MLLAMASLALSGCTSGLSEAKVQAMIDRSIAKHQAQQHAEEDAAADVQQSAAPASYSASPEPTPEPNTAVDNDLNQADIAFRNNWDSACQFVSNAIASASNPPVTSAQASQLKSYASRCNLRY